MTNGNTKTESWDKIFRLVTLHARGVLVYVALVPLRLFSFNTPFQYTLLILHPLIFGLTPFGWLHYISLTPTYYIISYEDIFDLRLLFQEHN